MGDWSRISNRADRALAQPKEMFHVEPGTPRPSEARMIVGDHCAVHSHHNPVPLRTVRHHIHPQEYGGLTVGPNLLAVCDTGHYNIHYGIDQVLDGEPIPNHNPTEKMMVQSGVANIRIACRPYLLVPEEQANLADWTTANTRRRAAIARAAGETWPTLDKRS